MWLPLPVAGPAFPFLQTGPNEGELNATYPGNNRHGLAPPRNTLARSTGGNKMRDNPQFASSKLEKVVDRMRGSSLRRDRPLAIVELGSSGEPLVRLLALVNETVLRVGPLELDLIDRAAKRGDRHIDLRPREFQLLKYMMQRSDKLLTRAALLKEVWHYNFIPKTNLVDVHMGRLRRKINGENEASMIRSVRGAGFVLDATPLSQGSPKETY
jgi:DNA-binding winged helix-turn-helix (wHTH) protein